MTGAVNATRETPAGAGLATSVRGLSKTYRTRTGDVEALRDASIEVGEGEFISLVGPSGCGKSTLLKLVGGLMEPSTGSVTVGGQPAREGHPEVGIMFQSAVLLPWRTVLQNVLLPTQIFGHAKGESRRRAMEMLELVGLKGFENHHIWELSGGMQQRVNLCRLLVFEPKLLLMDEPFAALDEFTRERLNLEIATLHERLGRTVVYVTHNIIEALFLSDRVVVMTNRPGRILGVVKSPLPRPRTLEMVMSEEAAAAAREIRGMLDVNTMVSEPDAIGDER
jgi:NitT/TauT family transport system ATP-binding protein